MPAIGENFRPRPEHTAQRLKLSTVGLLQYLAPSCLLGLGVVVYGEPFTRVEAVAFAAIWTALALYSADAFAAARERRHGA